MQISLRNFVFACANIFISWSFYMVVLSICMQCRYFFLLEGVPLVEFMYLAFTCIPGESYRR